MLPVVLRLMSICGRETNEYISETDFSYNSIEFLHFSWDGLCDVICRALKKNMKKKKELSIVEDST